MIAGSVSGDFDRFTVPLGDIPDDIKYVIEGRHLLDLYRAPEISEVSYGAIESALESMDERRDHKRAQDAVLERALEKYDERSWDLVLANVPYDISGYAETGEFGRKPRKDRYYQGGFDVLLVNIDDRWVHEIEVKPHKQRPKDEEGRSILEAPRHEDKVEKQLERHAFSFDLLNEKVDGFDWRYVGEPEVVFETDLFPRYEIPDWHEGTHYWDEEAKRKAIESEDFSMLRSHLLTGEHLALSEDNLLRVKEEGRDMGFL